MSAARSPRWALSFADICLLLLGFFVLIQAQAVDRGRLAQGMRQAFGKSAPGPTSEAAMKLFEPGEAVLRPAARARLEALGREAARAQGGIRIESRGMDQASRRFDGWELAAARVAAVARAIKAGGLAEAQIEVAIPLMSGAESHSGQRLLITRK
ncbi:flagellar motor protein [Sphingomonas oleivorans]|uniref:Flagellar motor protein n=1 Tax=Sphingomonas oleivorans TaxID=1735121 RepID=A0A2T5FUE5_9SPHN|nr:OmpA family protein [Sphingomonas oleivorans]PTQ08149.1 flagellar motor protein [Sphingomonas oleivorans]